MLYTVWLSRAFFPACNQLVFLTLFDVLPAINGRGFLNHFRIFLFLRADLLLTVLAAVPKPNSRTIVPSVELSSVSPRGLSLHRLLPSFVEDCFRAPHGTLMRLNILFSGLVYLSVARLCFKRFSLPSESPVTWILTPFLGLELTVYHLSRWHAT